MALIAFTLAILALATHTAAMIEPIDYNPDASGLGIEITKTSDYVYTLTIPPTTDSGLTYLPPDSNSHATFALLPYMDSGVAARFSIPAVTTPTTTTSLQFTSVTIIDPDTEGYIYTNSGPTTPVSAGLAIGIQFENIGSATDTSIPMTAVLFGCISTKSKPLTKCPVNQVRVVYSAAWNKNSLQGFTPSQDLTTQGAICSLPSFGTNLRVIGRENVPTGAAFACTTSLTTPPFDSTLVIASLEIKLELVPLVGNTLVQTTVPSAYAYGYPVPKSIFTTYYSFDLVNSYGSTDPVAFLQDPDDSTKFLPFDPNTFHQVRISISGGTGRGFAFNPVYTVDGSFGETDTDVAALIRIHSDCDLYSFCLTETPRREACLADDYLIASRPLGDFQCQCNPLFGGTFCQFSWVPRDCESEGGSESSDASTFDCYLRMDKSHLLTNWWNQESTTQSCLSVTPSQSAKCRPVEQFIGCAQQLPASRIDAASVPSEYRRFDLGSTIECAPFIPFSADFVNLAFDIYVIWDPAQTAVDLRNDYKVYSGTFKPLRSAETTFFNSTMAFSLIDPSWFNPPESIKVKFPQSTPLDARFYIQLSPQTAAWSTKPYSEIYSLRSACGYYNEICPAADNFISCTSDFTQTIDLTRSSCFCRDGFYRNADDVCVVFNLTEDCDGVIDEACCAKFPFVPTIHDQCSKLTTGTTRLTSLQVTSLQFKNQAQSRYIMSETANTIQIDWATLGATVNDDESEIEAYLWLFLTETPTTFPLTYDLHTQDRPDSQDDIQLLLDSFNSDQNNYIYDLGQHTRIVEDDDGDDTTPPPSPCQGQPLRPHPYHGHAQSRLIISFRLGLVV